MAITLYTLAAAIGAALALAPAVLARGPLGRARVVPAAPPDDDEREALEG